MATTIPAFSTTPNRNTGPETFADDMDTWIGEVAAWTTATNTLGTEVQGWWTAVGTWHTEVGQLRTQTGEDAEATAADRAQTGEDRVQTGADRTAVAADRQTVVDAEAQVLDALAAVTDIGTNEYHVHSISGVIGLQSALDALTEAIAASLRYVIKSADYTALAGQRIGADVTGGSFTITLPASPATGDAVTVAVIDGDVEENSILIAGNGATVQGDTSLEMDRALASVTLVFNGTEWRLA